MLPSASFDGRGWVVDPVSLILLALAAGAAAGVKDTASQAIKDGYAALKRLVSSRVAKQPTGELVVAQHAADPETWQAPLRKALTDADASNDQELVTAAQELMELIDPQGTRAGSYTITASGDRAVAAQTIIGNVSTGDTNPH